MFATDSVVLSDSTVTCSMVVFIVKTFLMFATVTVVLADGMTVTYCMIVCFGMFSSYYI